MTNEKGINNWREAAWMVVLVSWLVAAVATAAGVVDIDPIALLLVCQLIVFGFCAHVVWINLIKPFEPEVRQ